jgi:ribosomal protein S18 acetylase RimI-like enzyme
MSASKQQQVSTRPAADEDDSFLLDLFASTRPEFNLLNLPEAQKQALVSMQFNAQRQQYSESYPDADHRIVLQNDLSIGRMLVNRTEREITLIDIALLPEHRNAGIGTNLIRQLLTEAVEAKKPVRLHVFYSNPARHLYERLGFSQVAYESMYYEMIYESDSREQN